MSRLIHIVKDPSDVMKLTWDWAPFLDGDTIATSIWTPESGLTEDSELEDATTATVVISGGNNVASVCPAC